MKLVANKDWETIDTPFPYTRAQVNAWGVPADLRPEYVCEVSSDDEAGYASLTYLAPEQYFDPALVRMYPQIWTGNKFGTEDTGNPMFPARLGDIDKIPVTLTCEERLVDGSDVERNIAFEAFFHSGLPITGPGHPSGQSNKVYELMVWFSKTKSDIRPSSEVIATVEINGVAFEVHTKDSYIAFIAVDEIKQLKQFDFMEFIHETNILSLDGKADMISADWQLSALEFGVEVWKGAGALDITEFETQIELFDILDDEQPEGGIATPIQMQTGLIRLLERTSHNHILISERHRDIADDMASFAKALKNEN